MLLFLEGLSGFRQMNYFQIQELVSGGFVVVAIDHPHTSAAAVSFPDGRVAHLAAIETLQALLAGSAAAPLASAFPQGLIPYLADDVSFVLDALVGLSRQGPMAGRLDLARVGVFGVSLGGWVASEVCARDARVGACLFMDALMSSLALSSGLQQPAMWLTRSAEDMALEGWDAKDIVEHQTTMRTVYEQAQSAAYFVQIDGAFHGDFTDVPLWLPNAEALRARGSPAGGLHREANRGVTTFPQALAREGAMAGGTDGFCKVEGEGRLLVVTINRPEVMNALYPAANRALAEAFDRCTPTCRSTSLRA